MAASAKVQKHTCLRASKGAKYYYVFTLQPIKNPDMKRKELESHVSTRVIARTKRPAKEASLDDRRRGSASNVPMANHEREPALAIKDRSRRRHQIH